MTVDLLSRLNRCEREMLETYTVPGYRYNFTWSKLFLSARHPVWTIAKLRFLGLNHNESSYHWMYFTIVHANKMGQKLHRQTCEMYHEYEAARVAERQKKAKEEARRRLEIEKEQEKSKALWRTHMDMDAVRRNYPHLFKVPPQSKHAVKMQQMELWA
jgi:hypothetical protein